MRDFEIIKSSHRVMGIEKRDMSDDFLFSKSRIADQETSSVAERHLRWRELHRFYRTHKISLEPPHDRQADHFRHYLA
ncbi:MAG: hypothetical protein VB140_07090 [Burkholderia sp.]